MILIQLMNTLYNKNSELKVWLTVTRCVVFLYSSDNSNSNTDITVKLTKYYSYQLSHNYNHQISIVCFRTKECHCISMYL